MKAIRTRTIAYPQTLSFGLDDLAIPHWSISDTITICNLTDSVQTFTVGNLISPPAGITVSPAATQVSVPSHDSRDLPVRLDIDNLVVSISTSELQEVSGEIAVSTNGESLTVPWTVILASYIDLKIVASGDYSPGVEFIRLSDSKVLGSGPSFAYTGTAWELRELLPVGNYEIIARIDNWGSEGRTWFIRDSVNVNPTASLTMSQDEALYYVGPSLKDENGLGLDSTVRLDWCTRLYSKRTGIGVQLTVSGPMMQQGTVLDKVCMLPSNYVFDYYYRTDTEQPKVYSYAGQASPVLADQIPDIKPGDLERRDIEYRLHADESSLKVLDVLSFRTDFLAYGGAPSTPGLAAPFHQVWYAQGQPAGNFPWNGALFNHWVWFAGSGGDSLSNPFLGRAHLVTPNQAPGTDGLLRSSLLSTNTPVQESRGKKLIYGLGPCHYFGRMDNQATNLRVRTNTTVGMFLPLLDETKETFLPVFLNQAMDFEPVRLALSLRDSTGRIIDQGTSLDRLFMDVLPNKGFDASLTMQLPTPGRYTLQLWDPLSYVLSLRELPS